MIDRISSNINNRKAIILRMILAVGIFTMFLLTPMITFADVKVEMTSPTTVESGDIITVTVIYVDTEIAEVTGQLTYDDSKLEYVSGGVSDDNAGTVTFSGDAYGNTKIIFNIKFMAIGDGEDTITLKTVTAYNTNNEFIGSPEASKTITVGESSSENSSSSGETNVIESNTQDNSFFSNITFLYIGILILIVVVLGIILVVLEKKRKNEVQKNSRRKIFRKTK